MDLIERYLAAVGRELPRKSSADIIAELRDELCSKIEEREAALGRPLEKPEVESILAEFGHPLVVAGRYSRTQHLIGPKVFPFWLAWLRAVVAVIFGVYFVMGLLAVIGVGDGGPLQRALPDLLGAQLLAFAVVTMVFVAIEQSGGADRIARWAPTQLPPANAKPRSRFEATVEAGAGVVFILWWIGVVRFQNLMPYPRPMTLQLAPVWAAWFWPILGLCVAQLVIELVALLRPGWVRLYGGLSMVRYLASAAVLAVIIRAGHFADVSGLPPAETAALEHSLDLALGIGFTATVGVFLLKAAAGAWRLLRPDRPFGLVAFKTSRANG